MTSKTKVLSVHKLRRAARGRERRLQALLDRDDRVTLARDGVPAWARGVRVEQAGRFQWAVVATSHKGT